MQVCNDDADIKRALEAWASFGPANPDPSVEYVATTRDSLGQLWSRAAKKNAVPHSIAIVETEPVSAQPSGLTSDMPAAMHVPAAADDSADHGSAAQDDLPGPDKKRRRLDASAMASLQSHTQSQPVSQPPGAGSSAGDETQLIGSLPSEGHASASIAGGSMHALSQHAASEVLHPDARTGGGSSASPVKNAFTALMSAAKKRHPAPAKGDSAPARAGKGTPWDSFLKQIAEDPHRHAQGLRLRPSSLL